MGCCCWPPAILGVHWYSFFAAIQVSSVATGLLAFASFPMFVTFLEPLFFEERITRFDLGAARRCCRPAAARPSFDLGSDATRGVGWGILSGFTFAIFSLLSRGNVRKYPQLTVTAYQQAFALLVILPVAVASHPTLTLRTIGLLAILGFVFTATAHTLFIGSLKFIRAQTASIIGGLEPLYAIAFAALLLGEIPSCPHGSGRIARVRFGIGLDLSRRKQPCRSAPASRREARHDR